MALKVNTKVTQGTNPKKVELNKIEVDTLFQHKDHIYLNTGLLSSSRASVTQFVVVDLTDGMESEALDGDEMVVPLDAEVKLEVIIKSIGA